MTTALTMIVTKIITVDVQCDVYLVKMPMAMTTECSSSSSTSIAVQQQQHYRPFLFLQAFCWAFPNALLALFLHEVQLANFVSKSLLWRLPDFLLLQLAKLVKSRLAIGQSTQQQQQAARIAATAPTTAATTINSKQRLTVLNVAVLQQNLQA